MDIIDRWARYVAGSPEPSRDVLPDFSLTYSSMKKWGPWSIVVQLPTRKEELAFLAGLIILQAWDDLSPEH